MLSVYSNAIGTPKICLHNSTNELILIRLEINFSPRMKSATQDRHWPDRPYLKIGSGQTEQTLARPLTRPNRP